MKTSSPQQPTACNQITDMQVQYVECPSFNNSQEGAEFDLNFSKANPECLQYLRLCSPGEIAKGQYNLFKDLGGLDSKFYKLVFQVFPGHWTSLQLTTTSEKSPRDYCDKQANKFAGIIAAYRDCYSMEDFLARPERWIVPQHS
jgi:hypothetical protein